MVQLSAFNTPQFGWVKSRLPRRAQPVPPIFQPEVAAEAIVYASRHPRREFVVGWPAFKAIYGNKIAPWYADRVLARMGYEAQQHDGPEDPARQNNLYEPIPRDHGAHGIFDKRSRNWSGQWWLSKNRAWVALGALLLAGLIAVGWRRCSNAHNQ
jgi:hypothetical protein